jgi:hypothetical protein
LTPEVSKSGKGAVLRLPDGYVPLYRGRVCSVVIRESVQKTISKHAGADQRAGLEDIVRRFCDGGFGNVPPKKFNANEGWFPSERNKQIRLVALKPWQLRAYGFDAQLDGQLTFFITGVDTSKKQDRANQTILANAGAEAVRVFEELKTIGVQNVSRA